MNGGVAIFIVIMTAMVLTAWLLFAWLRAHSKTDPGGLDAGRQVELLTDENAGLKGQIGRLEERLAVLERIATVWQVRTAPQCAATSGGRGDLPNAERTAREIEQLRQD